MDPPARCFRGLIPAHAGKTGYARCPLTISTAHPRSRGENHECFLPLRRAWGSSPLTRGKPCSGMPLGVGSGLIPAHAGKTGPAGGTHHCRTAHPRSRGENPRSRSWCSRCRGSSPLTRGKLCLRRCDCKNDGLIPAHAGKTSQRWRGCGSRRAHPRSRGENAQPPGVLSATRGSSPLTRGKLP